MIEVENLSKVFDDGQRGLEALKDLSFHCGSGEILGLLGANGAGKTTCLRILSTVLKPTSGKATIFGHDVVSEAQHVRKNIGFISGNTGIYDRLTPQETIYYFGKLYGLSLETLRERCEEIYSKFKMQDFIHTMNGKLSTGMKQKVSIARTIVHDPPVLIFDEPTANLDVMVAKNVLDFIQDCREREKCVIFSTHIMSEAQKLCDRVAIIDKGKLLAIGKVTELCEKYNCADVEEVFFSLVENQE